MTDHVDHPHRVGFLDRNAGVRVMQKLVGAEPKKAVIIALLMEGNYHPSDVARMCRVSKQYVLNLRSMLKNSGSKP